MGTAGGYPFKPRSTASLREGQFWAIPLSDGSYACGVVVIPKPVASGRGSAGTFVAGLLDWWGTAPPTAADLGGALLKEVGLAPLKIIGEGEGTIIGERPLPPNAPPHPDVVQRYIWSLRPSAQMRWVEPTVVPPERRRLSSPLTEDMLRPARTPTGRVEITNLLSNEELDLVDGWLAQHQGFELRLFDYKGEIPDLGMIERLPHAVRLIVDVYGCQSIDGVRFAGSNLVELRLSEMGARLDLTPLGALTELRTLYVRGAHRHPEVIGTLANVVDLTLRATTIKDLTVLAGLDQLEVLDLQYGTIGDLDPLRRLPALRHLEIQRIKALDNLDVLGEMPNLERLMLAFLPSLGHLPSFGGATSLKEVLLERLSRLTDLDFLALGPALTDLWLADMDHLDVDRLRWMASHPTLRALAVTGTLRKRVASVVDLPQPDRWSARPFGG